MKIVNVFAKDTYATLEFSSDEINKMLLYLDNCTATYDGIKNPEVKAADDFIKEKFYPNMVDLLKHLKEIYG